VFIIKNPLLTVDTVVIKNSNVVLIKRKNQPYSGSWALPGGFVEYGETVEAAAIRETKEETGLNVKLLGIVGVYSNPDRDPRGHIISVCFLGQETGGNLVSDTDASDARYFDFKKILDMDLAFDHHKILEDAFKQFNTKDRGVI
jgi:8-oxo-dGTP diphosphatase